MNINFLHCVLGYVCFHYLAGYKKKCPRPSLLSFQYVKWAPRCCVFMPSAVQQALLIVMGVNLCMRLA